MSERQIAFEKIQSLLNTDVLPSLGPEPRSSRESLSSLENRLRQIFSEARLPGSSHPLIRSLVFLWHDYLDESHSISQEIHSADGSFLHGIMHRREPDYGNAKYWFHRVGKHECFSTIAAKATEILEKANATDLKANLISNGDWDAFAFIDACEIGLRKKDEPTISVLKQIQEIEFKTLLEHFFRQAAFLTAR